MPYIIMGRDECNDEFRVTNTEYVSMNAAYNDMIAAREDYPEARSIWTELLKDAAYFARLHASYDRDEYDHYYGTY
jgi:hypothetical protein